MDTFRCFESVLWRPSAAEGINSVVQHLLHRDKQSEFSLAKQGKGKTRHFRGSEIFLYFVISNEMSFSLIFFYFFIVHL